MLETALGETVNLGYHVRGNSTLQSLWSNPVASDTFITGYGNHTVALPNNQWDYLTLQSFPANSMPTLGEEVARMQDFIGQVDLGSGGQTQIIVYGPWAGSSEPSWTKWYLPAEDNPMTLTSYSEAYHNLLYDKVESLYPGRVQLASAGKVIRAIRDLILVGNAPFESTGELYRDPIHMSAIGRFAASTTIQTVIHRHSTVGQPVPRDVPNWSDDAILSDEQARWIQLVVWETLLNDPRSGVDQPVTGDYDGNGVVDLGDFDLLVETFGNKAELEADGNRNGFVEAADYTIWRDALATNDVEAGDYDGNGVVGASDYELWRSTYGAASSMLADGNGDGAINAEDYTVWYNAYQATMARAVPEPAGAVLLGAGLGSLLVRRRVVRGVQAA